MTNKIRRINLFGGPGSGKSTTAAGLFYKFKSDASYPHNIELIQEYIKTWAYMNRPVKSFSQVYTFAKQMHREDVLLSHGVDLIITDSPILLNAMYAYRHNTPGWEGVLTIIDHYEQQYPALNIFINRLNRPYKSVGRYESYEEARDRDLQIFDWLTYTGSKFMTFDYNQFDDIYNHVRHFTMV